MQNGCKKEEAAMGRNHEVTNPQMLLDKQGELREPGWSRSLIQKYDRKMIKAPEWRIKEWDYYLVLSDGFGAAFTISDDGYIGLQSVSLLLFGDNPWEHTETVLNAFPMGKLKLPADSSESVTEYKDKRLHMRFTAEKGTRHIRCSFSNFCDGKPLKCNIRLQQPEMDSMVIATPWDRKHAFYYNQKINCMRASGWVEFDGQRYSFNPQRDFGTLDWGRGVWTYDNTWYWSSGNQKNDKSTDQCCDERNAPFIAAQIRHSHPTASGLLHPPIPSVSFLYSKKNAPQNINTPKITIIPSIVHVDGFHTSVEANPRRKSIVVCKRIAKGYSQNLPLSLQA